MMASSTRSVIIVENKYQKESSSDVSITSGCILHIPAAIVWSWKDAAPNTMIYLVNINLGDCMKLHSKNKHVKAAHE